MNVWQNQNVDQFREIAGRLASVIETSLDRTGAMAQFTESLASAETFTELMIEYSGRWFTETGGRSLLIGPELFWLLSEPGPRRNSGMRGQESPADFEQSAGTRARKLLLICVFEALTQGTQNQWTPEAAVGHAMSNGMG